MHAIVAEDCQACVLCRLTVKQLHRTSLCMHCWHCELDVSLFAGSRAGQYKAESECTRFSGVYLQQQQLRSQQWMQRCQAVLGRLYL